MGKRIAYYQSKSGKSLKDHLIEDYATFRDWILNEHRKSMDEFDGRLISKHLENFLTQSPSLHALDNLPQETVDELTFEYLLTFCDYGEGKDRFELIGPLVYTWRYQKSSQKIHKVDDTELINLWDVLIYGKSVLNGKPFVQMDEKNVVGFWNKAEKDILMNKLTSLHSKLKAKDREGIEFVISALEAMNEKTIELIIDVEK